MKQSESANHNEEVASQHNLILLDCMNCQLCDRTLPTLTAHHLVPRQHTKRRKQDPSPTIAICAACHKQIHTLFENRYLAQELNTLEKLRDHPQMAKFIAWVQKQDPTRKVRSFRGGR